MAENVTITSTEELRALASRLQDHADAITNAAARLIERDIRSAARIITDHATWRFHLKAIVTTCTDENAAAHLRELLGEVA